jgi:hypothetical protein
VDPRVTKFNTERLEPKRAIPNKESVEPHLQNDLKLREDARNEWDMIEHIEANRVTP